MKWRPSWIIDDFGYFSCYLLVIIISDGSCWDLTKNKLVKVYQNWGDVFKIEFAITVTKLPRETWTSVFHFSADGNYVNYGDRIPGLWIYNPGNFVISSAVNGNSNYYKEFPFVLGKQYQMTIQQFKDSDGKYWYEIVIDGESKFKIENTQTKTFSNVKLYASDPWYSPFSSDLGSFCDIKIRQSQIEG